MHDSTLDLFCNHPSVREVMSIDEAFTAAIEEEAAKFEVTVDYYLEEFFIQWTVKKLSIKSRRDAHTRYHLFVHHQNIMKYQITSIQFDCSLDDEEGWDESDQIMTEERLSDVYTGQIWDADDEEDLIDEISTASGWCIKSIDYRHILS